MWFLVSVLFLVVSELFLKGAMELFLKGAEGYESGWVLSTW